MGDPVINVYVSLAVGGALLFVALFKLCPTLGSFGTWLTVGTALALFRYFSFWYLFDLYVGGKIGVTLMLALPLYCPETFLSRGDPFSAEGLARRFSWALVVGSYVIVGVIVLVLRTLSSRRRRA